MKSYIKIFAPEDGKKYSSFYIYLPAGEEYYTEYRFVYVKNPIDPSLGFSEGPNVPANCELYRIREAYIGVLDGDIFTPSFRALQSGEIGFALREVGAGDFSGGVHGDEVFTYVCLTLDGKKMPLDEPYFGSFESFEFDMDSNIWRCNTPSDKIIFHRQKYTTDGNTLKLAQYIEWIADGKVLQSAYTPMLTVQRIDPADRATVLTDTVEFYDHPNGNIIKTFDTTPYGADAGGKYSDPVCAMTPSTAVKVYGKNSGFSAECGYTVVNGTIPDERIETNLDIRYKKLLDNKIYFKIARDIAPKTGEIWQSDIYYRLNYRKNNG